jgi:hypothetical protein
MKIVRGPAGAEATPVAGSGQSRIRGSTLRLDGSERRALLAPSCC